MFVTAKLTKLFPFQTDTDINGEWNLQEIIVEIEGL